MVVVQLVMIFGVETWVVKLFILWALGDYIIGRSGGFLSGCIDARTSNGITTPLERRWRKRGWRPLGSTSPAATPVWHSKFPHGKYLTCHWRRRLIQAPQRPCDGGNMREHGPGMMGGGSDIWRRGIRNNHLVLINII